MSYYDEDFYQEPSEFDILVEDFKKSLAESVKGEHVAEIEKLRKENAELQDVKANFNGIVDSYKKEKRDLEYQYDQLKRNVRRERLSELLKEFEVELYTVSSKSKSKPKCDKCDDKRRIYYTTPLGNETYENCECSSRVSVYEPHPIILTSFSIRNGEAKVWYRVKSDRNDEWLSYYEDEISGSELVVDESQFEGIGYAYKTLFKDEETAQKYCDYKNSK